MARSGAARPQPLGPVDTVFSTQARAPLECRLEGLLGLPRRQTDAAVATLLAKTRTGASRASLVRRLRPWP